MCIFMCKTFFNVSFVNVNICVYTCIQDPSVWGLYEAPQTTQALHEAPSIQGPCKAASLYGLTKHSPISVGKKTKMCSPVYKAPI